jgi:hypothetical protein
VAGWHSTALRSSQSTSVREPLAVKALHLTPNPAIDRVSIADLGDGEGQLSVYDAAGRLITQQKVNRFNNSLLVGDWLPGVYIFRLRTEGKVYSGKLVKNGQ